MARDARRLAMQDGLRRRRFGMRLVVQTGSRACDPRRAARGADGSWCVRLAAGGARRWQRLRRSRPPPAIAVDEKPLAAPNPRRAETSSSARCQSCGAFAPLRGGPARAKRWTGGRCGAGAGGAGGAGRRARAVAARGESGRAAACGDRGDAGGERAWPGGRNAGGGDRDAGLGDGDARSDRCARVEARGVEACREDAAAPSPARYARAVVAHRAGAARGLDHAHRQRG